MPRMARVVVPRLPHHVTQRGNRRQPTFFGPADYAEYLRLLGIGCAEAGVAIWAYCLMPNHVHLVAVPEQADSLARLFRVAHRRYTLHINHREGWQGHLWQERFHSFPMDERHLLMTLRYIELNPVRAGLCSHAADWPWSSIHAHLGRRADPLLSPGPVGRWVADWLGFLGQAESPKDLALIRRHTGTGRPAGTEEFVTTVERQCGRRLRPRRPGPRRGIAVTVPGTGG